MWSWRFVLKIWGFKLSAAQKLKSWDSFTINVSSLSKLIAIKMWIYVFPSEMFFLSRTQVWHLGDNILLIRVPFLRMTLLLSPPVCTDCISKGLQWPCHRLQDQGAAEESKLLVIEEKVTMNKMQSSFSHLSVLFQICFVICGGVFWFCWCLGVLFVFILLEKPWFWWFSPGVTCLPISIFFPLCFTPTDVGLVLPNVCWEKCWVSDLTLNQKIRNKIKNYFLFSLSVTINQERQHNWQQSSEETGVRRLFLLP